MNIDEYSVMFFVFIGLIEEVVVGRFMNKGNNKITELRTILQRESQIS